MRFRFNWWKTGFSRSIRKLKKLDKKQGKSIWRKALRAGAAIIMKAARPLIPQRTKALRQSLGIRIKARRKDKQLVAVVGPRQKFTKTAFGRLVKPSKYAHLVESGRRGWKKGGRAGGKVAGVHWLRRAVKGKSKTVFSAIVAKIQAELKKL